VLVWVLAWTTALLGRFLPRLWGRYRYAGSGLFYSDHHSKIVEGRRKDTGAASRPEGIRILERLQTDRPLAPFDDQGYSFSPIVVSAKRVNGKK
jgi:hypothetical protein